MDKRSFLILFFIVIVKSDSHYSFFPAHAGVTYLENRKDRQGFVRCLQGNHKSYLIALVGSGILKLFYYPC